MTTLVYRYGLLPPTHNGDVARRHLRAAQRYRNLLIEVERGRRAAIREAEREDAPLAGVDAAIAWLDAECQQLAGLAKRARAGARQRGIAKALREQLKDARAQLRRAKRGRSLYRAWWLMPRLQRERDRINSLASDFRRSLRQNREFWTGEKLYHGTYSGAESAVEASRKAPLWDGDQPNDPRFVAWRGQRFRFSDAETAAGTLGCQLQGGVTWDELTDGCHTRAQLAPPPQTPIRDRACRPGKPGVHRRCPPDRCTLHERDPDRKRAGRGARQAMTLRLRQGTTAGGDPLWVQWPIQLARPLPEGARVTWIDVHCQTVPGDIGPREEWYATFRLRPRPADTPRRNDGLAVAVDVGWRMLPDGSMRVAYWRGEDGRHDQLVLTPAQLSGLTRGDGIRAARDHVLEKLRLGLAAWMDATPEAGRPEWLRQARGGILRWRSPKRFRQLLRRWAASEVPAPPDPLPTPEQVRDWLAMWSRWDDHLAGYEHGQRTKAIRRRRDHYRRFAAWLNQRYDVVVLESFDKRQTNRTPLTEDGAQTEGVNLRHAQRIACTHQLCESLKSRFGQRGVWVEVNPENTTRKCHVPECGSVLDGDAADGITQRCGNGHIWDQDDNAGHNLLAAWFCERSGDGASTVTARSDKRAAKETRWARARRLRIEKDAREATARNEDEKQAG